MEIMLLYLFPQPIFIYCYLFNVTLSFPPTPIFSGLTFCLCVLKEVQRGGGREGRREKDREKERKRKRERKSFRSLKTLVRLG